MKKLALASTVVVPLLAIGAIVWSRAQHRLVVVNQSGVTVTFLTIAVGGETIRFEGLPPGDRRSARFRIRGDDHFVVRGRLANGTEIDRECGYVTGGLHGERAYFVIELNGELEFSQSRKPWLRPGKYER